MKKCRKCENEFPLVQIVDGKKRNFQKREFCLTCSPFGTHNTKKDIDSVAAAKSGIECKCQICYRAYVYKRKGDTTIICASCQTTQARRNLKKRCIEYKGGKCQRCDYTICVEALEFHHLDPAQKDFAIGDGSIRSWKKIILELEKCLLICCRCHREKHAGIW
jgi:hypothetical protein